MPFVVPLEETAGVGAGKPLSSAPTDVGAARKHAVGERKSLQIVGLAPEVDIAVPIGGHAPDAAGLDCEFLHDVVVRGAVAAHVVAVDEIDRSGFSDLREFIRVSAGLWREENGTARTEVLIGAAQIRLVGWREGILNGEDAVGEVEADVVVTVVHPVGKWRCRIVGAVSGGDKHAAVGMIHRVRNIGGQTRAAHPHAGAFSVWRGAKDAGLLESRGVVGQDPTMPRAVVAVRTKADVDDAVEEQERRPIVFPFGIEVEKAARAAITVAGNLRRESDSGRRTFPGRL